MEEEAQRYWTTYEPRSVVDSFLDPDIGDLGIHAFNPDSELVQPLESWMNVTCTRQVTRISLEMVNYSLSGRKENYSSIELCDCDSRT